jgi:hypothetical protein
MYWKYEAAIWHSHEVVGFDNIPDNGPALLIMYHAALPIDAYYIDAKIFLEKKRKLKLVGDRFLFQIPGW